MTTACQPAAKRCAALLREGLELIAGLPKDAYGSPVQEGIWSSPGTHTRHIVNYFDSLISGIDARTIDYAERKRQIDIEQSRSAGILAINRCLEALETLASLDERLELEVRTDSNEEWTGSTLARELRFVAGHTIHHYALIRLILAQRGISTPDSYGVSASTLAHRQRANS